LQFATGNDNTSTWVDIGVAGAEITAAAILGVAFAPEIAVAGLLYGIISVGGGSDWIDNHFGYRKKE
jgi:hypothetical protein